MNKLNKYLMIWLILLLNFIGCNSSIHPIKFNNGDIVQLKLDNSIAMVVYSYPTSDSVGVRILGDDSFRIIRMYRFELEPYHPQKLENLNE